MSENKNNFGCGSTIGSIAALITAVGGLLTILYQIGVIGPGKQSDIPPQTPTSQIGQYEDKAHELEQKIADIDANERRSREAELKDKLEKLEQQLKEREGKSTSYSSNLSSGAEPINLTGNWYTSATPGVSYKIVQYDESVTFEEISSLFGIPTVSAAGNGSISGSTLKLSYNTLFGTQGKGSLRIKENGDLLTGSLTDLTSGMVMPLSLQRE
jgi:hypothetical protein